MQKKYCQDDSRIEVAKKLSVEKMSDRCEDERAEVEHTEQLVEELLSQVQMNVMMVMKMVITLR